MSSGLSVKETFHGTIDPGIELDFYDWQGQYSATRKRAWWSTVEPDPWIDFGGLVEVEVAPNQLDLAVTAIWSTVWVDEDGNATYQRNTRLANIGGSTATYHIIRAETDN